MNKLTTVTIEEWSGDRSSALGGFCLIIDAGGEKTEQGEGTYDSETQRKVALSAARIKGRRVADALKVDLAEKLLRE